MLKFRLVVSKMELYVTLRAMAAVILIVVNLTTECFAKVPKRPPNIDIGSFECISSSVNDITRDVIVYWQNIDDNEKHSIDDLFEYRAYYTSMADNNTMIYHPCDNMFANHATFVGLELNTGYNIRVYSANKHGLSEKYASIYIPGLQSKDNTVSLTLRKVKKLSDQGIYELSWEIYNSQNLFSTNQLNYFTLYWCENDMMYPNQCNGFMDWIHVPNTESRYTITVPHSWKEYQFAISANSEALQKSSATGNIAYKFKSVSSGMVWETCTTLHLSKTSKVKSFWTSEVGSTYIALRWKFDCSEEIDFIRNFHVFYCPIDPVDNYSCLKPPAYQFVESYMKQYQTPFAFLLSLEPSTMYKISIVIYTLNGRTIETESVTMATLPDTE